MREFKFRVYTKCTKKMSSNEDLKELLTSISKIGFVDGLFLPNAKDNIVMQYTGIKDKNGKEIYEGDIVEYFRDELAIIKYMNGAFVIESKTDLDCMNSMYGKIKVIGNIYENKKLLEC